VVLMFSNDVARSFRNAILTLACVVSTVLAAYA
jgi:hypothetical protein